MGKFFGEVGFSTEYKEVSPGVFEDVTVERKYRGDVLKNTIKMEKSDYVNDDINVNNQISIVADLYAYQNFFSIRYVRWMGALWKVTNVEVQRPRLTLTIGGVYRGKPD